MAEPVGSFSGLASGIQWRDMIDQIMQVETQRRLTPLQTQATAQLQRKVAWGTLNGLLGKLTDASKGLRDGSAFGQFKVTAQNSPTTSRPLFTASASASAGPGTYEVEVRALARQTKLRGGVTADSSVALGQAGTITVNGKEVAIAAGDSLIAIRDRINAVNGGTSPSGVTASIVDVSATEHYLTFTADATGANGIRLTDGGGVLAGLGISTGSQSRQFASDSSPIASLLGLSPQPQVRTILVDGHEVTVDLGADTLQSLMMKINDAGGSATVKSGVDGSGTPVSWLDVQGNVSGKGDDADTTAILDALGFTRSNQIAAGADARVRIDGLDVVRSSNTISDALAGVTLSLQEAELGQTVGLTVGRDLDATAKKVQDFAAAFNAIVDFQNQQRQAGAPLYANGSLRAMVGSLKNSLISNVGGITAGDLNRLGSVGVALAKDGTLAVDAEKLKSALTTNFAQVENLFSTRGTATGDGISFIAGSAKTQAGDHAVTITHAATRASAAGAGWSGSYLDDGLATTANQLVLSDAYSGKSVTLDLNTFNTVDSLVTELNEQFRSQGLTLSASKSGNDLVIDGTRYGASASFSVAYARDGAAVATSPIGFAPGTFAGTDVAGTIGGVAATGAGQILTAAAGSPAEGLSIQYSGSVDVAAGSATYTLGAGGMMERLLDGYTRTGDGLLALNTDSIDQSVGTLERRQADVQGRLDRYRESLIRQFSAMEAALSRIQSQGTWLTNQIASMNKSTA
jgi:flagellar hook-associated protein 2